MSTRKIELRKVVGGYVMSGHCRQSILDEEAFMSIDDVFVALLGYFEDMSTDPRIWPEKYGDVKVVRERPVDPA